MSGAPPALAKRLAHELRAYSKNPQEEYIERLGPVSDENMTEWEAVMKGVPNSPYEGGRWLLHITIPPTYPLTAPKSPQCGRCGVG
ncbi:ubiquitin-conjugating enzyme [Ascosphaera apis ARSEF 7405]|uniref:Ubiquitin-conjugating enzyme n=1 Tax=Ascosphaera apis ARSEF 7405 TaxID=392613 RepID=A0A167YQT5_9EURO|nr:ubiquitin-conjugating enzyme [Ascosphaera apis ARSEF 7405]